LAEGKLFISNVAPSTYPSRETPIISQENIAISQISPDISELPQEDFLPEKVNTNSRTTHKSYKIISVDDSPTILREISRYLEDEHFVLVTINESVKAVLSIIRHKPDLILLDLNMPGIDGYELCRIIRNNSMFKHIPIIFVTSNKGIIDQVKARLVGASGYLTKPFTRAELLKIIFMHLP
jgi:twitching motility two-component system response regulator PilG